MTPPPALTPVKAGADPALLLASTNHHQPPGLISTHALTQRDGGRMFDSILNGIITKSVKIRDPKTFRLFSHN